MATLLPASVGTLRQHRRRLSACEARLAEIVTAEPSRLSGPAGETLAAGGKRLRPLLVFCSAPAGARHGAALVSAAAAVELVHMATLVHDDLLDDAKLRRGRPTVASSYGPERAIQVGDFLFAEAFAELARGGIPDAVRILAAASLDLSQGEIDQQRAAFDLNLREDAYFSRCRRKTSSLFSAAAQLGALVGGAGPETQRRLGLFGERVGIAFQIFDDILDIAGTPSKTGKQRGTDLIGGTITLPVIYALQMEPELGPLIAEAGGAANVDDLCERLAGHPAIAAARDRALAFVAEARDALDAPLDGVDASVLLKLADGVVDRYS